MIMKYFVFGGNGFVGNFLVKALTERSFNVVVCDVSKSENPNNENKNSFIPVDIRNIDQIRSLPINRDDIVINLAANQYHNKVPKNRNEFFFSVNTYGTENLLKVSFEKGCRNFLMFSTDMIYGKPQYLPVDVRHPQNPFGAYGRSKKAAEQICFEYRAMGMNITIMRPRMIMGPGRLGILVKLFKLIDLNLPVPTIGNGRNHYQMISVFDCVTAILYALDKGLPNKEYNLGSKNPPDIKTLLQQVISSAHSRSFVIPTPGGLVKLVLTFFESVGLPIMYNEQFMIADEEYHLDISETEKDLDWEPKYNDSEMIKSAYESYKNSN